MRATSLVVGSALVLAAACFDPTAPSRRGVSTGGVSPTVRLAFTVQPSNAIAGQIITPAIQVTAQNPLGNPDSGFTANVTVAIATNPVGGILGGTKVVAPVGGVASFGDLTVDRPGTGYTLTASAPGATDATSTSFNVTATTGAAVVR